MRVSVVVIVAAVATSACLGDLPNDPSYGAGSPGGAGGGESSSATPTAVQPQFGWTSRHYPAPPPLSGGTLANVPGRSMIVAADPDRDAVFVIDLETSTTRTIPLSPGDEPGRVVVDGAMRAHVALRSGGALATIDLNAEANAVTKRAICTLPRGLAWEEATDEVHVACAGGELVTLAAAGGPPTRVVKVARDLRDVVVTRAGLVVSTFRDADVIRLARDGSVQAQSAGNTDRVAARVAWRMIAAPSSRSSSAADPGESVMMAAQRTPSSFEAHPPTPPAYYEAEEGCTAGGPLTVVADRRSAHLVPNAVLPIDIASDDSTVVLVSAANAHLPGRPQIVFYDRGFSFVPCSGGEGIDIPDAEITSVVYEPILGRFYAFSREPAQLVELDLGHARPLSRVLLSTSTVRDTGHAIFHASSGRGGTACASCHPEGRDDGHSWRSVQLGPRRTPSLLGTLAGTAPYHWNGEASGLEDLMTMTFTQRMKGPELAADQKGAIASWLAELPPLRRAPSSTSFAPAVVRGRAIFESATARCASCHGGSRLTNNATIDVGTGGELQVPSLVGVVHRAPYLHDGSRANLRTVLYQPHGGARVNDDEIDDLVTYLESL